MKSIAVIRETKKATRAEWKANFKIKPTADTGMWCSATAVWHILLSS
jgi:hypothetical protein